MKVDVDKLFRQVEAERLGRPQEPQAVGESPIEDLLRDAILRGAGVRVIDRTAIAGDELVRALDARCTVRELFAQAPVGIYRCDLLLRSPFVSIAIECDGHDFHDRSHEQASHDRSRDRELLRCGVLTLRFTGRDIARDVHACAAEALSTFDVVERLFGGRR